MLHGMGLDFGMDFDEQGNPIPGIGRTRPRLESCEFRESRESKLRLAGLADSALGLS